MTFAARREWAGRGAVARLREVDAARPAVPFAVALPIVLAMARGGVAIAIIGAIAGVSGVRDAASALPSNCVGTTTIRCSFEYNGTDGTAQTFDVPSNVSSVTIDAWGTYAARSEPISERASYHPLGGDAVR
jgi:hypothetical protein